MHWTKISEITDVTEIITSGGRSVYEIKTANGAPIVVTGDHKLCVSPDTKVLVKDKPET